MKLIEAIKKAEEDTRGIEAGSIQAFLYDKNIFALQCGNYIVGCVEGELFVLCLPLEDNYDSETEI